MQVQGVTEFHVPEEKTEGAEKKGVFGMLFSRNMSKVRFYCG